MEEKLAIVRKQIAGSEVMIAETEALLSKLDKRGLNGISVEDLLVLMRDAHLGYERDRDLCLGILKGAPKRIDP